MQRFYNSMRSRWSRLFRYQRVRPPITTIKTETKSAEKDQPSIEERLADLGDVEVLTVEDPLELGAMGGLRLAMEVPGDMWKNLTLAHR